MEKKDDLIATILDDLDHAAQQFEADAIREKDDGQIRAATYHAGVARGLELARLKIRRLTDSRPRRSGSSRYSGYSGPGRH